MLQLAVRMLTLDIERTGVDQWLHRRRDPTDQPVGELLLLLQGRDPGAEAEDLDDVKTSIGLDECRRPVGSVLVE